MTLAYVSRAEAEKQLAQFTGGSPDAMEAHCDLVRAEVHARGHSARAATLERVMKLLAPVTEVTNEQLSEACDALVREGDLVLAPQGILYATPVRFVQLEDRARIFGSIPTRRLANAFGQEVQTSGATRSVAVRGDLSEVVQAMAGVIVSPSLWAGLDRAPLADAAFLSQLDHRLEWEPLTAVSLERDDALDWRAWDVSTTPPRWLRSHEGRLWWARTRFGGHHRAWTAGGTPATSAFVPLSADEADRARFSLLRQAEGRAKVTVRRSDGRVELIVPAWLPRPEYRWLSLLAEQVAEGKGTCWRIASRDEARVTQLLADRLGLVTEVQ